MDIDTERVNINSDLNAPFVPNPQNQNARSSCVNGRCWKCICPVRDPEADGLANACKILSWSLILSAVIGCAVTYGMDTNNVIKDKEDLEYRQFIGATAGLLTCMVNCAFCWAYAFCCIEPNPLGDEEE